MADGKKTREYGKNMPSWLKALLFALICTLLIVLLKECVAGNKGKANTPSAGLKKYNNTWNCKAIDSSISLLKDGDLVIRTGRDITSQMFRRFNQKEQTYSHCGIVLVENGYPFIYHSIGGEDNPDAMLRRDSACFWFSPANNLGLGVGRFDISHQQVDDLKKIVRQYYKERKKFDMQFDLGSNDRLYCAEFVYKALNSVAGDGYIKPSSVCGVLFVAIDNLYMNEHTKLVCQVRYK